MGLEVNPSQGCQMALLTPPHQDNDGPVRQPPVKKPPPKPVWVDVSVLPRIPKIKRDSTSSANSSSGNSSSTLPGSSANSLAGIQEGNVPLINKVQVWVSKTGRWMLRGKEQTELVLHLHFLALSPLLHHLLVPLQTLAPPLLPSVSV